MKKATTTTPDPELSTPLGSGNEVNANAPHLPQPQQGKDAPAEGTPGQEKKPRQQPRGDVCGSDGACI